MEIAARFNHCMNPANSITTCWTYRESGPYEGAQVLDIQDAIDMATSGEDASGDDWFSKSAHTELLLIKVRGFSGDKGPLGYRAIIASDVVEVRSISASDVSDELYMAIIEGEIEEGDEDAAHALIWDIADVVEPTYYDPTSITAGEYA